MIPKDPIVERNEKVVREFIRGWETRDLALVMAQITDDMCYLNQPLEAVRGRDNVAKMIGSILAPAKRLSSNCSTCSVRATKY